MKDYNWPKLALQRCWTSPFTVLSPCWDHLGDELWFSKHPTPTSGRENAPKWCPMGHNGGGKRWIWYLRWRRSCCSLTSWTNAARCKRLESHAWKKTKHNTYCKSNLLLFTVSKINQKTISSKPQQNKLNQEFNLLNLLACQQVLACPRKGAIQK